MYPRAFFDTYWRGEKLRKNEVFVAMPFHKEFEPVWEQAIKPAIENGLKIQYDLEMVAKRVDATTLSSSIVVDILDGVAHSALVFVDISVAREGTWCNQRNGNVMYELGLAHAVRPDTDVVVVRSDNEPISFDVSGINVRSYPKDDLAAARSMFVGFLQDACKQRRQAMNLITETVNQRLDASCRRMMVDFGEQHKFAPFGITPNEPFEKQLTVRRLLDLGIIRCEIPQPLHFRYAWTDFGINVFKNPNIVEAG